MASRSSGLPGQAPVIWLQPYEVIPKRGLSSDSDACIGETARNKLVVNQAQSLTLLVILHAYTSS
jgi:hypothetical protein